MSLYAVTRQAGPGWTEGKGAFEQPGVNEHGSFMKDLADRGFVLCGGPLAGTEHGRIRALLLVEADDEAEVHRRLADDPWTGTGHIVTTAVESWMLVVGSERALVEGGEEEEIPRRRMS